MSQKPTPSTPQSLLPTLKSNSENIHKELASNLREHAASSLSAVEESIARALRTLTPLEDRLQTADRALADTVRNADDALAAALQDVVRTVGAHSFRPSPQSQDNTNNIPVEKSIARRTRQAARRDAAVRDAHHP